MSRQRMVTVLVFGLVACALCVGTASAQTVWIVDHAGTGDFLTIQAAIDAASNGDTVIVKDGTYTGVGNRDISFLGKVITVRSQNGPSRCTIDCESVARGFSFHSGEPSGSLLVGFTIVNGLVYGDGGGIYLSGASPTIRNCVVHNCTAWAPPPTEGTKRGPGEPGNGGGIFMSNSSPVLEGCVISANTSISDGGGIAVFTLSSPSIVNCLIIDNQNPDQDGGGIQFDGHTSGDIINSTIVGNYCEERGGGIDVIDGSSVNIIGSILWDNIAGGDAGDQIGIAGWDDPSAVYVSYSDVMGGEGDVHIDTFFCPDCRLWWLDGNLNQNPNFVTGALGDYYLYQLGPCIDAGGAGASTYGLDKATTDTNHIGDTGTVDMGFHYPVLSRIELLWPEDASILSSEPSLHWSTESSSVNGFVVGFYLVSINPFWQTAFSTYQFGNQFIPSEGWDMPSGLWTLIPSDTYVGWWVVGLDAHRSPIALVQSETYGWFQKQ